MNGYLKIGSILPAGLAYKTLNQIYLPSTIANIGSLISAFNFKDGSLLDVIAETSNIVGNPEVSEGGVILGKSNYINTSVNESEHFTAIVVFKPLTDLAEYNFVLSNYVAAALTGLGHGTGFTLAQNRTFYPNIATGGLDRYEYATLPVKNQWCVAAMSRNTSSFSTATRSNGQSSTQSVSCSPEVYTQSPFGIGSSLYENGLGNTESHSLFAFSAIHNVSMTAEQLKAYVDKLATELNSSNPYYAL